MGIAELIPLVVTGGVVKKFSDSMLPAKQKQKQKRRTTGKVRKAQYPSPGKYRPF